MQQSDLLFCRKSGGHICHGPYEGPDQNHIEQRQPQVRGPAFCSSLGKHAARAEEFPRDLYGKDREKGPEAKPHFHSAPPLWDIVRGGKGLEKQMDSPYFFSPALTSYTVMQLRVFLREP